MDEADYTGLRAAALGLRAFEIPFAMLTLFAGAAFLTKMCYLSLAFAAFLPLSLSTQITQITQIFDNQSA